MNVRELFNNKDLRRVFVKGLLLALIFLIYSALLGPILVNSGLLYKYSFFIYGGLGSVLIFVSIAFLLLARDRLMEIKDKGFGKPFFFLLSGAAAWLFYYLVKSAMGKWPFLSFLLISHLVFLSVFIFLGLAIFHVNFIKEFVKMFKRELLICFFIAILFYGSMFFVWESWEFMSRYVSQLVHFMLKLSFPDAKYYPPHTISAGNFTASIEKACSGMYSMFLFACLYLLLLFLDWKEFNKKKAAVMFPLVIIGLFFVNCLRIYLLMLVGVLISPAFAKDMFHSYIGMVLFIVYFIVFLLIFYKWMKR